MMEFEIVPVLLIIFFATLVRSTLGFGQALVALPFLALFMPLTTAVPICVLVSVLIATIILIQDKNLVDVDSAKRLIIFAAIGVPMGIYLLISVDLNLVKLILGIFIVLYVLYSLLNRKSCRIPDRTVYLFAFGFTSGALGGAYGLNGPPLIIYGNLRGWSTEKFRATLQAYFLPLGILGMFGFWYEGLWTLNVGQYFLLSIPIVAPTIFLGRFINKKMSKKAFTRYVYATLIVTGTLLIYQFD